MAAVGRSALLVSLFSGAFIAPLLLLRVFFAAPLENGYDAPDSDPRVLLSVTRQGAHVEIPAQPPITPSGERDFLVLSWLRLDELPANEEAQFFLAHFEAAHPFQPGFAFGISREKDSFFPVVHWRDREGRGGNFSFSHQEMRPGEWHLASLYFSPTRELLSAQIVPELLLQAGDPLPRASAFRLTDADLPAPVRTPLVFGSLRGNGFVGALGPLAILEGEALAEQRLTLGKKLLPTGGERGGDFFSKRSDIKLILHLVRAADGAVVISPESRALDIFQPRRAARRARSSHSEESVARDVSSPLHAGQLDAPALDEAATERNVRAEVRKKRQAEVKKQENTG